MHFYLQNQFPSNFAVAVGCDMWDAYPSILSESQRRRANQCELLDEMEEWMMIMKHYCFIVASSDAEDSRHYCGVGSESLFGFMEGKCQIRS